MNYRGVHLSILGAKGCASKHFGVPRGVPLSIFGLHGGVPLSILGAKRVCL